MTLTEFLLARIAEDAIAGKEVPGPYDEEGLSWWGEYGHLSVSPARVLTECETKTQLVKLHAATHYCIPHSGHASTGQWYESGSAYPYPCPTLSLLALPYADHPDYREEWRQ